MNETLEANGPDKQEVQQNQKSEWFDPLIKIVQGILDFNMNTYTDEKAPTL